MQPTVDVIETPADVLENKAGETIVDVENVGKDKIENNKNINNPKNTNNVKSVDNAQNIDDLKSSDSKTAVLPYILIPVSVVILIVTTLTTYFIIRKRKKIKS